MLIFLVNNMTKIVMIFTQKQLFVLWRKECNGISKYFCSHNLITNEVFSTKIQTGVGLKISDGFFNEKFLFALTNAWWYQFNKKLWTIQIHVAVSAYPTFHISNDWTMKKMGSFSFKIMTDFWSSTLTREWFNHNSYNKFLSKSSSPFSATVYWYWVQ